MNSPDTPIEQRDIHFDLTGCDVSRWHARGMQVSHLFNALSQFFPEGEKFFIESVRHYKDRIADPVLQRQVQGFIGQEAMHGREHRAYNQALAAAGYPVAELEQRVIRELAFARKVWGPKGRLASTIALEHLTAILADQVLNEPRVLAGSDPRMTAIWRWHAVEETEHKAVAFDVYRSVVGGGLAAYLLRVFTLVTSTLRFYWFALSFHHVLLRHDRGPREPGSARALLGFLFVDPGVWRRIFPAWCGYFRPGFHPWQRDNRAAVETWKAALAANGAPPG
jgi:predicted metal-dependent hydrolase